MIRDRDVDFFFDEAKEPRSRGLSARGEDATPASSKRPSERGVIAGRSRH
jgi:hypothetical protein